MCSFLIIRRSVRTNVEGVLLSFCSRLGGVVGAWGDPRGSDESHARLWLHVARVMGWGGMVLNVGPRGLLWYADWWERSVCRCSPTRTPQKEKKRKYPLRKIQPLCECGTEGVRYCTAWCGGGISSEWRSWSPWSWGGELYLSWRTPR